MLYLLHLLLSLFNREESNVIDLVEVDGVWQLPKRTIDTYV